MCSRLLDGKIDVNQKGSILLEETVIGSAFMVFTRSLVAIVCFIYLGSINDAMYTVKQFGCSNHRAVTVVARLILVSETREVVPCCFLLFSLFQNEENWRKQQGNNIL